MPRHETYATHVRRILKMVHPHESISKQAMHVICSMLCDWERRISVEAQNLLQQGSAKTLTSREIQTAVRLILPGELAKHAVSEGTKAVTKFTSS